MTAVSTEAAEAAGVSLMDEIVWEERDILRPGMDFKNGTVYVTIPGDYMQPKTVGRGKHAEVVHEKTHGLIVITNEGKSFPYTPERVADFGFDFPRITITPDQTRWSLDDVVAFTKGKSTMPHPPTLWQGLREVYEQYIEFARQEYYDLMPIFVMGSYMFRLYKAVGYLHFNGTAASGKSQNLRILDALAFNTQWASSMSSAALYRSLDGHPGTVCIDEAEGFEGERGEELRRILNAGYLDGSTVKRVEKGPNDQFLVQSYNSYGPKAIASINVLDNVIGSRCLIVAMRPALRSIPEFDKDDPRWERLRDRLYLWLMYHAESVSALIEQWNTELRYTRAPQLIGRAWQITQMYISIADYIDSFDKGDRCNRLIAFFNEYFSELAKQQDATDRIRMVLRCLPEVLRTRTGDGHWYYLKDIHTIVSNYLEEDQKEYYKTRALTRHLAVLGFTKRDPSKQGVRVLLEPATIRQEFKQRRVEPLPEDVAWANGEIEYEPKAYGAAAPEERVSVWANMEES
jgi:hypothetical protein